MSKRFLRPPEELFSELDNPVRLEPEFPLQLFQRRRSSERVHTDHAARSADISLPSKRRSLFNRDPCRHFGWQHAFPVAFWLLFKDLPRRHRDHPRTDTIGY